MLGLLVIDFDDVVCIDISTLDPSLFVVKIDKFHSLTNWKGATSEGSDRKKRFRKESNQKKGVWYKFKIRKSLERSSLMMKANFHFIPIMMETH